VIADRLRSLLRRRPRPARPPAERPPAAPGAYAGDFTGRATLEYTPVDDDKPDPGEVVWAWVPYEEDASRGKDRPALVVGRDGGHLLALMLTSKDHDRDTAQEARFGRHWFDLGAGGWDPSGRPSEVRLDRVLRLDADAVRRIGAVLDRARYDAVTREARKVLGWG
jgi:hypothetical protein